jgi:hypothetical protein
MKSDLRNLATYEESYAADSSGLYFGGTSPDPANMNGFVASQNVTVEAVADAGPPAGWTATATHALTAKVCTSSAAGLISCT